MLHTSLVKYGSISTYGATPVKESITIGTSLAPGKEMKNQQLAINSWLKLGFKVVSMNSVEEIGVLQPHFPDIEFVETQRDGRRRFHKPYIYFDDILHYFTNCNSTICGIVNSDILLLKDEFYSFLQQQAIENFIYGSRMDIETIEKVSGQWYQLGFDYFFFNKEIVAHYPPTNFLIGLPMWDYWVVLIPIYLGIPVKKVITPHAYHVKHKTNWDRNTWQVMRDELMGHVKLKRNIYTWKYSMYIFEEISKNSIEIPLSSD